MGFHSDKSMVSPPPLKKTNTDCLLSKHIFSEKITCFVIFNRGEAMETFFRPQSRSRTYLLCTLYLISS